MLSQRNNGSSLLTIIDRALQGTEWHKLLEEFTTTEAFKKLDNLFTKESTIYTIYPPEGSIFFWATLCPLPSVKVVILGQDPYHGEGQAHGLAFSVPASQKRLPPSLQNIFKELRLEGFNVNCKERTGSLEGWAAQGVLLLNTALTVRANCANSHAKWPWNELVQHILHSLTVNSLKPLVFMAWGKHAQEAIKGGLPVKLLERHLVLSAAHPSPLSASRGFFGCGHFVKANAFLEANGLKPIDWTK